MKEIELKPIDTQIPLREACAAYRFPRTELPIKGGWGFSLEDAIIIDKNDSTLAKDEIFDGIKIEYSLIEERISLEFYHLQKEQEGYKNINWKVEKQETRSQGDRIYDKLLVKITALPFEAWKSRRIEWKENGRKPDFDLAWFQKKTQEATQYSYREFWFDISSFFGQ